MPSADILFFLVMLLVFVPWVALRTASALRTRVIPEPSRERAFAGTIATQLVLLALAMAVAHAQYIPILPREWPYRRGVMLGIGVFALAVAVMFWRIHRRSPLRDRTLSFVMPHSARDLPLFAIVCLVVGTAEEIVYRGVLMVLVQMMLLRYAGLDGDAQWWTAALICTLAFTVAHAAQGGLSVLIIAVLALLLHVVAKWSGNLAVCMAVHAAYDFVSGSVYATYVRPRLLNIRASACDAAQRPG